MKNHSKTELALSIVAPCYNEQEVINELHRRCAAAAEPLVGKSYELVLVDDGSQDDTRAVIAALADAGGQTVGVFLARNYGHQKALSAGLSLCRGQRILIIDSDLQDPPELLADMMALMDDGADVVFGQRTSRPGESFAKRSAAAVFYRLLSKMVEFDIPMDTGDFRLISRRALDVLNAMPEEHRFIRGMVSWIGFKQVPLPYARQVRFAGQTKYPFRKMLRLGIDAITGFSIVPLRIATLLSIVVALLGLAMIGYVEVQYFLGHTIQGWSSVMVAVLMVGSVQLFGIGILGEYLGRLYMQSKRRPLYVIDQVYLGEKSTRAAKVRTKIAAKSA